MSEFDLATHRAIVSDNIDNLNRAKDGLDEAIAEAWPVGSKWIVHEITHGVTIEAVVTDHNWGEIYLQNLNTAKARRTSPRTMLAAEPLE